VTAPAVFDIPPVGDTGRFPAGGTCATQIDRALLKRKRVGRQELASEANVSRRSASSAGRYIRGAAIGFIPAASNRGCEANIKS